MRCLWIALHLLLLFLQWPLVSCVRPPGPSPRTTKSSYKILPKPCKVRNNEGTCMFVWDCMKTDGKSMGMCKHGFMFGSCCRHDPSHNQLESSFTSPQQSTNSFSMGHGVNKPTTERPISSGSAVFVGSPVSSLEVTSPITDQFDNRPSFVYNVTSSLKTTPKRPTTQSILVHRPTALPWQSSSMSKSPSVASNNYILGQELSSSPSGFSSFTKPVNHVKPTRPPRPPITRPSKPGISTPSSTSTSTTVSTPRTTTPYLTTNKYPWFTSTSITTSKKTAKPSSSKPFSTFITKRPIKTTVPPTKPHGKPTKPPRPSVPSRPTRPQMPTLPISTSFVSRVPSTTTTSTTTTTTTTSTTTTTTTTTTTATTTSTSTTTSTTPTAVSSSSASTTVATTTKQPQPFPISAGVKYKECGVPPMFPRPEARIVNGSKSPFGGWPWQASVRRTSFFGFSSTHRCGGALINDAWVATAGHCVDDLLISQIRIRLGEYNFASVLEPYPHIERSVKEKRVHPKYNFFTYEYDLALVRLEDAVDFMPHICPVCLPGNNDLLVGDKGTVTGWGRLSEGGTLPSVLQQVEVPIVSNEKCKEMFLKGGRHEFIPDIFLCAGYDGGGKDSCQGDSGGPLQVRGKDGRWFLAGIISWGIGCAEPNLPGVCTRISKFTDWIMSIVTK